MPDKQPQSILLALDPFNLLYESNMGTGGMMDGIVNKLFVNRGQAIVFFTVIIVLVIQITPSIKRGMYIVYSCVLFWKKQIILLKLE